MSADTWRAARHEAIQAAMRATCAGLRAVLRHTPGRRGKAWLWEHVVQPHVATRRLVIAARTPCGARIEGGFPDEGHARLYFLGAARPGTEAVLKAALRPGDVAIDVGAGAGWHSLLAARCVGPGGRVHAIEPSPRAFARLRRNLDANAACQVTAHNLAATEAPARVPIWRRGGARLEAVVHGRPLPEIVPPEALQAARVIRIGGAAGAWGAALGLAPWLGALRAEAEVLLDLRGPAPATAGGSAAGLVGAFAAAGFAPWQVPDGDGIGAPPPPPRPLGERPPEEAPLLFRRISVG